MTAARAMGFNRVEAARYSFLLSIPANGAASALVIGDALKNGEPITGGVIMTGCSHLLRGADGNRLPDAHAAHHELLPFVIYRVILGGALLGLIWAGVQLGTVN